MAGPTVTPDTITLAAAHLAGIAMSKRDLGTQDPDVVRTHVYNEFVAFVTKLSGSPFYPVS
jgi:hypothetical protein